MAKRDCPTCAGDGFVCKGIADNRCQHIRESGSFADEADILLGINGPVTVQTAGPLLIFEEGFVPRATAYDQEALLGIRNEGTAEDFCNVEKYDLDICSSGGRRKQLYESQLPEDCLPIDGRIRNRHDLSSAERKQMPAHRGFLAYFPDAIMVVALMSRRADLKHSPDADTDDPTRPQWNKGNSSDHGDCVVRHQMDVGEWDEELGLDYQVHVAWRGMAQLQECIDENGIDSVVDWGWESPFEENDNA